MKGGEDAFNLSLMLVDIEASEAKTLFVNFDEFVPDSILPLVGDNSISDLIYYFRLNQDILKEKLMILLDTMKDLIILQQAHVQAILKRFQSLKLRIF